MLRKNPENVWHGVHKLPAMLLKDLSLRDPEYGAPWGRSWQECLEDKCLSRTRRTLGKRLLSFLLPGHLGISGP